MCLVKRRGGLPEQRLGNGQGKAPLIYGRWICTLLFRCNFYNRRYKQGNKAQPLQNQSQCAAVLAAAFALLVNTAFLILRVRGIYLPRADDPSTAEQVGALS